MLTRIRRTVGSFALKANVGYRLAPPCSINAKWKPAVLAIACMRSASRPAMGTVGLVEGGVSVSFNGIAGWFLMTKGPLNAAPKSGFFPLRYRVYQLRSTLRFMRFVSRLICLAPVAWLLGRFRNGSRSTGTSPLDLKKA